MSYSYRLSSVILALVLSACSVKGAPATEKDPSGLISDPLEIVRILSADNMDGRQTGTEGNLKARDFLRQQMSARGLPIQEHAFTFSGRDGQTRDGLNLLTRIEGETDGPVMVVTAHYDHVGARDGQIYNGADDNASGVAGALAVADHFLTERPEYDVVIALLDAEEMGLQGARALVADGLPGGGAIVLNMNFDMLSKNTRNELYAAGARHRPFLEPMLNAVAAKAPIFLKLGHDDPALGSDDWTFQSDHGPFHQAGIPFVYFGVEDHPDYHQPTDIFDTIPQDFFLQSIETVVMAAEHFDTHLGEIAAQSNPDISSDTPVALHGALAVSGRHIVGAHGAPVSLAGPSFFWSTTGWKMERFYNQEAVKFFAEDWKASIVRAAMAAERDGSYLTDPMGNAARAITIVEAAVENGLYVVVDWHSHRAEENVEEAVAFFKELATTYGETPNLIYEIYNEPLDTTDWETVIKPYAERVISEIRKIDPDNLIIVGSQSWDQEVDKVADDPITGFKNIAYSLHFYAASEEHKEPLREKARYALEKGLPMMATEWGSVNYDGDGEVDRASSLEWLKLLKNNHISHMIWAVSDADEGAAMFIQGAPSTGNWTDEHLTESGKFAREIIRGWNAEQLPAGE